MFEAANTLIEDRLRALWTDTLIDWDNVEFKPVRGTAFVRLQIEWVDANVVSVSGRDRGEGYINLSVFIPSNTGTEAISTICDDLATIFNKYDTGNLRFKIARTIRVGEQEQWYRRDVIIPFTYDECN